MFTYHFIIANVIISLFSALLLIIKYLFKNYLSPKANYVFWLVYIIMLIFAFIPEISLNIYVPIDYEYQNLSKDIIAFKGNGADNYIDYGYNLMDIIFYIWLAGVIIYSIIYIFAYIKIRIIIKSSENYNTIENIKIKIFNSDISPFSFGIINKYVILPYNLSKSEMDCVLAHEIIHHKHKDISINLLLCILNILYWFNPFIYYVFDRIRLDMEIYCDYSVLKNRNIEFAYEYGNIIINFAANNKCLKISNNIASANKHLKERIKKIASLKNSYNVKYFINILLLSILILFIGCYTINIFGYSIDKYSFNNSNAVYMDLSNFFDKYDGCFVLYDEVNDNYTIYNRAMAENRYSPYSTYKIAIALNGIENKIISADYNYMEWNGEKYPFKQWNKDQSLNSAMADSVNWYFQNIDNTLGYIKIKENLNKLSYGNKAIAYNKEKYWLDGTLKISPIEQTDFLKTVFNTNDADPVKNSIKLSDNFYGKTGSGKDCGWFIGAYESNPGRYFFSVYIEGKSSDGKQACGITKKILENII